MTKYASFRIIKQMTVFILGISLFCTRPPAHKPDAVIPFTSTNKKENFQKEIQGYCIISFSGKSIKTRLMATCENGQINAVLMDELGVPLTVIAATDSSMKLERYFPPVTEQYGNLFGFAITSYFRSIRISPPQKGVIHDVGYKNVASQYFFTDSTYDSTIIYLQKDIYSMHSGDSTFSLLDDSRDSVCHCVWE